MPFIEIDEASGFCFGVVNAIKKAEEELSIHSPLYCLGDIVHNKQEVERLRKKGLLAISKEEFSSLHHTKVLLRAHGEPPSTYQKAKENAITLVDATCPVVLQLQKKILQGYQNHSKEQCQIAIFGKKGHAEVLGLVGQTEGNAIVLENKEDLNKLDFNRPILLYSQTTKSVSDFQDLVQEISTRISNGVPFEHFDTICRQVANRTQNLASFAKKHDVILFLSSAESSNGKVLFERCKEVNPRTFFINTPHEVQKEWILGCSSIGICGATSTPKWL
ncbi:MAG TPA: 4-hydroxy-3-methylbut-2-enyl diphosphate reductase, partial [Porphyromonadaceae bacterium]|nr:4-hydroxy-3-methylbut-2-enyl diphosphate reductase [Porphyromonadaceae bacterium]